MPEDLTPQPLQLFSFSEFAGLTTLTHMTDLDSTSAQKVQASISALLNDIASNFAKTYPQMEAAADRLADMGWTFPMLVTPKALVTLADPTYADADIETMLCDFYTDMNFELLRVAQKDMMKAPSLSRWQGLLQEAFDNLYEGRVQIPVPALLAITEGIIADESGNLNAGIVKVRQMAAGLENTQQHQSIDRLIWRSIRRFVDHLFANAPFSGSQPPKLNRHWILHGRDAGPWTQADAVRLFASLHTLVS